MTIKRPLTSFFLLSIFTLSAFGIPTVGFAQNTRTSNLSATLKQSQSSSPLTLALNKGTVQVKTPAGPVLSNIRTRLRFGDGTSLTGEFELAAQDTVVGGEYRRSRYRLKPDTTSQTGRPVSVGAELEIQHYLQPDAVVAFLNYNGPELAATDGVQLIMSLDNFARGMALKQLKLYWTAPTFVSDYRLLSAANQLLLWKQMQGDAYHLLVPLAGDGMIGTLGVSEIEYRYEFRVSSSSNSPGASPHRIPLFAYASSNDPYRLPRDTYKAVFASGDQFGRLRWEKSYPEIFSWLGWCSWNTYYHEVTEEKVLNSVRSLRDKNIPVGFVLVDDGWLQVKDNKLAGFDADPKKFPNGLAGLSRVLREQYHIPHVGVWHTFQGYWDGVDKNSEIGQSHKLYTGIDGKSIPDPRDGAGAGFYTDWYSQLNAWGFDFVKVDNQASNGKFTNGFLPLFMSGSGEQRNLQEAARKYFSDGAASNQGRSPGLNLINCMEMSLENAFNWRFSNLARNSDDYLPDSPQNAKEHVFQNAYNAYWTSNFAYPDWDMFQSHDPNAEFHAVARAISGGPIYFTDEPGKEHPEILRNLIFSDGRLLMMDEPGQVTPDLLLTDVSLEPTPLKVFGRISRPGLSSLMFAAFNVNKSAPGVTGSITRAGVQALIPLQQSTSARIAVYQRSSDRATLLDASDATIPLSLNQHGFDLFTVVPVDQGVAVFGLLDKYLGPAAIISVSRQREQSVIRLREAGDFGAWLERPPVKLEVDGRDLQPGRYSYRDGMLHIPHASFGDRVGEREIRIVLGAR
jgi:raffinose synthase